MNTKSKQSAALAAKVSSGQSKSKGLTKPTKSDESQPPARFTPEQWQELVPVWKKLDEIVQKYANDFIEVGMALKQIRDDRLYIHGGFTSWNLFCLARFGYTGGRGYQLARGAEFALQAKEHHVEVPTPEHAIVISGISYDPTEDDKRFKDAAKLVTLPVSQIKVWKSLGPEKREEVIKLKTPALKQELAKLAESGEENSNQGEIKPTPEDKKADAKDAAQAVAWANVFGSLPKAMDKKAHIHVKELLTFYRDTFDTSELDEAVGKFFAEFTGTARQESKVEVPASKRTNGSPVLEGSAAA